jgi:hypothetical protein
MKDSTIKPLWKKGFGKEFLETSWDTFYRAFMTYKGKTLASLLNSQTSLKTDKSHMAKLSVTINLAKSRKRTGQTHSGWRQIGLFWRSGNLNGGHHNFRNFNQQHSFYKGPINDDDGHKELLPGSTFA